MSDNEKFAAVQNQIRIIVTDFTILMFQYIRIYLLIKFLIRHLKLYNYIQQPAFGRASNSTTVSRLFSNNGRSHIRC